MTECAIVGGGIVGCATALELARRGSSPLLLEASTIGAGVSGASLAAIVRHLAGPVDELPFVLEATARWQSLARELREHVGIDVELETCGQLRLVEAGPDAVAGLDELDRLVEAERAAGLDVVTVTPGQAGAILPALATEAVAGGSWCPGDAKLNALSACHAVAAAAARLGAEVKLASRVVALAPGAPWRLVTEGGIVEAATVVLATGPWTRSLLEPYAPRLACAFEPRRAQCCATERLRPVIGPIVSSVAVGIAAGYTQLHQTRHGEVLFNTVTESANPRLADGELARDVDPRFLAASAATLTRLFPDLASARLLRSWAACETWTPDQRFVIGPVPGLEGLVVAAGDSGTGFLRAPLIGELVAQLVLGEGPDDVLAPYLPDRFVIGATPR